MRGYKVLRERKRVFWAVEQADHDGEGLQCGKGFVQCHEQLRINIHGVDGNRNHTVKVLKCMSYIVGLSDIVEYVDNVDDERQRWRMLEHLCCWCSGVAEET